MLLKEQSDQGTQFANAPEGAVLSGSTMFATVFRLSVIPDFVSAQYFENKLMEFDQICICTDIDKIGWDCYASIFANYNIVMVLD